MAITSDALDALGAEVGGGPACLHRVEELNRSALGHVQEFHVVFKDLLEVVHFGAGLLVHLIPAATLTLEGLLSPAK